VETVRTSETLVYFNKNKRRYIAEINLTFNSKIRTIKKKNESKGEEMPIKFLSSKEGKQERVVCETLAVQYRLRQILTLTNVSTSNAVAIFREYINCNQASL
jgi:hypothetical protein